MLKKRAAYFWLTGAVRTERRRSRVGIRLGWVDIEASFHLRGVGIRLGWVDIEASFHLRGPSAYSMPRGTGDVSQFDSLTPPRPTTSRPRDIPAGNITQQQADSPSYISLRKSLRGC